MTTVERETATAAVETETATSCPVCGVAAVDGRCLEVGTCSRADEVATRGAAGSTAKYAVPAAWNARGYVD